MPRSGLLAAGAVVGALAVTSGDRRALGAVLAFAALALILAVILERRRPLLIAAAIGIVAIAVRGASMPAATELAGTPSGDGPWRMLVESIGSPRDGHQVATLRTLDGGLNGFRVAATLPRYPSIEPGDRVGVDGRTRPRPDSPYGHYLERLGPSLPPCHRAAPAVAR